jgi:hypothetical protein
MKIFLISETKSIIRQSLRETLNLIIEGPKYSTKADYYRTYFLIKKVNELYGSNEYFQNVTAGQMLATAIVNIHGFVKITTNIAKAGDIRANQPSSMKENPFYLSFQISAGRGIEHPDSFTQNTEPAQTRDLDNYDMEKDIITLQLPEGITLENGDTSIKFGVPRPGSPASDAAIKAYLVYGDEILNFVAKNLKNSIGYKDGKGGDISNDNMSQEDKVRKLHKDLLLRIKKPRIQPSEWQTFLRALKYYGIDITNLNTAKDLSTDEQWDDVIKKAGLIPTAPKDDEKAYQDKIAAMEKLKANINRRKNE